MLAKIMHHCAFLIITFSTYTLCIQNGKSVTVDKLQRDPFFAAEARQSTFHQSAWDNGGFMPSNSGGGGFNFPDKHQNNANNRNELSTVEYGNPYPNNKIANNNQQGNPHNLALNTGEYSANANNPNNYPYQQHPNAIPKFGYRDSPNVPNANDIYLSQQITSPQHQLLNYKNPNYPPQRYPQSQYQHQSHSQYQPQSYLQRPTYAHDYGNYLYNRQPNYNRRPTPPPIPPPVRPAYPATPSAPSYSPYQDKHLPPPYRNDLTSSSSPTGLGTYPSQYANQFGNFILPFGGNGAAAVVGNPLGSLLGSFGAPFASGNPLSMQIIRGLENIARNDDLQCVPKVLCQMFGSPTRRAQLPSFITSPVLTSFISSLPSSSPALVFGRAALLGLSGGEYSCSRTYPKCPQNEDDILYYLNNHRGGFFKFFSEPDSQAALDTQYQQHTTQPSTSSSQQQSIFNFLTGLASSATSPSAQTNTNQGNVNSFMTDAVTNGIGSLFGNIISGFLSGQTATRRNDDREENAEEDDDDEHPEKDSDLIELRSMTNSSSEEVEGRILNNKSNILAYLEPNGNPISFPPENGNGYGNGNGQGYETENQNYEGQQFESEFRFPSTPHRDEENSADDYRLGKRVNFIDSDSQPTRRSRTKMIFPDRTGTGNLRFDNDEYFRVGKIINRPQYNRGYTVERKEKETRRIPNYKQYTTRPMYTSSTKSYLDRYASSNYGVKISPPNKEEDTSGNVYVTNGQGVVEYYINKHGRKVYI